MAVLPPPRVDWQVTGNHWLAIPCIHPADASLRAVGMVRRATRGALEMAGSADFLDGTGAPLLGFAIEVGGVRHQLSEASLTWERAFGWIPAFTCTIEGIVVRGTIFAPYGREMDVPGAVFAIALENRTGASVAVHTIFSGQVGHQQTRVRTGRRIDASFEATVGGPGVVVVGDVAGAGLAALAFAGEPDAVVTVDGTWYEIRHAATLGAGERVHTGCSLACAPEPDGAVAMVTALRRAGWRDLLAATRDSLRSLEQSTGSSAVDQMINRNLLFAYFYGVARAIDDAGYYLVRSRAPWHGIGMTVRDWEALMWTLPAVQMADPPLARELLLRVCEVHGYAPGQGIDYLDGALFEPGFNLDGVAAYALAVERYIRDTRDDRVVDEPVIAETLYVTSEQLGVKRHATIPLYATTTTASGSAAAHPYVLHTNAVVAQALDVLKRTLDEETAGRVEDPDAVRAAIRRHFVIDAGTKGRYATAVDLNGAASTEDDPSTSALWLAYFDAVPREDSVYRRTVKAIAGERSLPLECAKLLGPDSAAALKWLRSAPLWGGLACEAIDGDGNGIGNCGDAALAGLLAWTAWYSVHGLGQRP